MDRKMMSLSVICIVIVSLMAVCVTASARISNAPLYTYRMEQASSEMNFLPTKMNSFTYITENRYTLDYGVPEGCNDDIKLPKRTRDFECPPTVESTCPSTCLWSCWPCWP